MSHRFIHLKPCIGARVWTPMGEGVLVCVADDYATVILASDGTQMRYYDATAVLLYANSSGNAAKPVGSVPTPSHTEIIVRKGSRAAGRS